jgi:hypothetical protein
MGMSGIPERLASVQRQFSFINHIGDDGQGSAYVSRYETGDEILAKREFNKLIILRMSPRCSTCATAGYDRVARVENQRIRWRAPCIGLTMGVRSRNRTVTHAQ